MIHMFRQFPCTNFDVESIAPSISRHNAHGEVVYDLNFDLSKPHDEVLPR